MKTSEWPDHILRTVLDLSNAAEEATEIAERAKGEAELARHRLNSQSFSVEDQDQNRQAWEQAQAIAGEANHKASTLTQDYTAHR